MWDKIRPSRIRATAHMRLRPRAAAQRHVRHRCALQAGGSGCMDATSNSPWAGTGLDALSGRVFEPLAGHAAASSLTVAAAVGASPEEVETALRSLEDALLVIRIAGRPPRWKAGPPRSS